MFEKALLNADFKSIEYPNLMHGVMVIIHKNISIDINIQFKKKSMTRRRR
jgi:hypothetical protein